MLLTLLVSKTVRIIEFSGENLQDEMNTNGSGRLDMLRLAEQVPDVTNLRNEENNPT